MKDMIHLNGQLIDASTLLPAELLGGDVEDFQLSLKSAHLASGSEIEFAEHGITVIVGSNNAGKSTFIREVVNRLYAEMRYDHNTYKIVDSIQFRDRATKTELAAWFMTNCTYKNGSPSGFVRGATQQGLDLERVSRLWEGDTLGVDRLADLASFFVHYSNPFDRIGQVSGASPRPNFTDPPHAAMHYIEDSEEAREEIKSYSRRIFGESLTVDYLSGQIQFRVGETAVPAPPIDDVNAEYRQDLASLPTLQEQGDGMRSLLGLLIPLATTPFPIVLADEPEAFLHPPQAVALGKILGEISQKRKVQIILATHDKNLLAGLMASSAPVSVVRIDRRGPVVRAKQLNDEPLRELWKNPALKYSNALDGLFHRLVVIAEADPDCRFYAAALESFLKGGNVEFKLSADDVLFIPSGGLGDMPKLAKSLRDLSVPVIASPDMDAISNTGLMKRLVASLGGSWEDFRALDQKLRAPFSSPSSPRTVGSVLTAIQAALNGRELEKYTTEHRRFVEAHLHVDSVWREVKRYGVRAFPGESRTAMDSFMSKASEIGLVLVHAGELESMSNVAVSKGPEWLPAALAAGSHEAPDARGHVQNLLSAGDLLMNP
ncbi:ATP-dependent endonuclease [Streptomyces sp. NPDC059556]|uniref:ATP-dependent nuclease n=1 Tax=Streptomyces sp. NPDC059556 TaxID=3346863 RepID=UPI00367B98DA